MLQYYEHLSLTVAELIGADRRPVHEAVCAFQLDNLAQRSAHAINLLLSKYFPGRGHNTTITVSLLDAQAWEKIIEVVKNPEWVRARVAELREEVRPPIDAEEVNATLADIDTQLSNLFALAKHAQNQKTIDSLSLLMQGLEKQKLETESLLYDIGEDEEERQALEKEIQGFEAWAAEVRGALADPNWIPTYEDKRRAVRVLGIVATVYPTGETYPYRYQINVTVPEIMKRMKGNSIQNNSSYWTQYALLSWTV